jgi:hypothetical protein
MARKKNKTQSIKIPNIIPPFARYSINIAEMRMIFYIKLDEYESDGG